MLENLMPKAPIDPPWMAYARSKIGIHEAPGDAENPYIDECIADAGLPKSMQLDSVTAWCGCFCNKCMKETGHTDRPQHPAAARSWFGWGVRLAAPVHGCINVYSRPPDPSHAHVGFYDATTQHLPTYAYWDTLGGNEDNQVKVKPYPKDRLLGSFWPAGYPLPPDAVLWVAPPLTAA